MDRIGNIAIFVAGLAICLALSACDSEQSNTYDLEVDWNIAGLDVCRQLLPADEYSQEEVVFDKVEINIYEAQDTEAAIQAPIVVPCETDSYLIARLDRGAYLLTVDAVADYEGEELSFFRGQAMVTIPVDDDKVDIELEVGSGAMEIMWQFESELICGVEMPGEISDVLVAVGDQQVEAECGAGNVVLPEMAPGTYEISAKALDGAGEVLYESNLEAPVELLPGQAFEGTLIF